MSSAPQGGEKNNTCNIYVGEVLYKAGFSKLLNSEKKYYSAKEIYNGADGKLVNLDKVLTKPGDIAAWGGTHVGIVVKVNLNDNTIVTREGYHLSDMGGERTNTDGKREILSDEPRIFRVK